MARHKTSKEEADGLKLTASQLDMLRYMKAEKYTLKDSAFLGVSNFALHKAGQPPVPVNRKTAESMVGKGFIEVCGQEKNVFIYKLTKKGLTANIK